MNNSQITIVGDKATIARLVAGFAGTCCGVRIDPNMAFGTAPKRAPSVKTVHDKPVAVVDPRDPDEERDDVHTIMPKVAELGGLIRRARKELSVQCPRVSDIRKALATLGRAQDLAETFS